MAHHAGARDLAESADMRQARWSVSRFKQNCLLGAARHLLKAFEKLAGLLEGPGTCIARGIGKGGIGGGCHEGGSQQRQIEVRCNLWAAKRHVNCASRQPTVRW